MFAIVGFTGVNCRTGSRRRLPERSDYPEKRADIVTSTDRARHLIALNVANGSKKIESRTPSVSVFNFHYASPPTAVKENFALNKVIGENETGFKGTGDTHYRRD